MRTCKKDGFGKSVVLECGGTVLHGGGVQNIWLSAGPRNCVCTNDALAVPQSTSMPRAQGFRKISVR